jgi:pyruvate/2-oxoglutarate dehydrogenase complex dihydrolipoamide acyltransferase (E2) component
LAKILVPGEAKGVAVGKLIGLLVEEKKDIATLDVSKYQAGQAEAPKKEVPKETSPAAPKKEVQAAVPAHDFENEYHAQEKKFRITPSAGFYLKTYQVLPSEVKASGPKTYIQKGDVLSFVKAQNIQKG